MAQHPSRIPNALAANLVDPSVYADGRIHECYRWLRAHIPLGVAEPEGFDRFWVVTRHADILRASLQDTVFRSGDQATALSGRLAEEGIRSINGGSPHLIRSLIEMDAPDHHKYRSITQAWFKAESLRHLEEHIREVARAAVASLTSYGGHCDFVASLAESYPIRIIGHLMGIPEPDEMYLLRLTKEMFGVQDIDLSRPLDVSDPRHKLLGSLPAVIDDFTAYFHALHVNRRAGPRGDLISVIANAVIDARVMPDWEALSYYIILATAGHHTVALAIAGALQALSENPLALTQIQTNLSLIPDLVNEALRWTTPAKTFMRSAAIDTGLGGISIAKGDRLMLCYASGNRDEAVFEEPFQFKLARRPNKHLSFGYGVHMCLGQHLAKLEMRILFEELLPHLASLEPNGVATQAHSWFVNGLKTLPLRFTLV